MAFKDALIGSESGGRTNAVYRDKKGRSYEGLGQFGQARLKDLGLGTRFSMEDYRNNVNNLQSTLLDDHFNDIRGRIKRGGLDAFYGQTVAGVPITETALLGMAHLGGFGGMEKFLRTGGAYNPQDELGTSLMDYGQKFSTPNSGASLGFGEEIENKKPSKFTDFISQQQNKELTFGSVLENFAKNSKARDDMTAALTFNSADIAKAAQVGPVISETTRQMLDPVLIPTTQVASADPTQFIPPTSTPPAAEAPADPTIHGDMPVRQMTSLRPQARPADLNTSPAPAATPPAQEETRRTSEGATSFWDGLKELPRTIMEELGLDAPEPRVSGQSRNDTPERQEERETSEDDPWNWEPNIFRGLEAFGVGMGQIAKNQPVNVGGVYQRRDNLKVSQYNASTARMGAETSRMQEARLAEAQRIKNAAAVMTPQQRAQAWMDMGGDENTAMGILQDPTGKLFEQASTQLLQQRFATGGDTPLTPEQTASVAGWMVEQSDGNLSMEQVSGMLAADPTLGGKMMEDMIGGGTSEQLEAVQLYGGEHNAGKRKSLANAARAQNFPEDLAKNIEDDPYAAYQYTQNAFDDRDITPVTLQEIEPLERALMDLEGSDWLSPSELAAAKLNLVAAETSRDPATARKKLGAVNDVIDTAASRAAKATDDAAAAQQQATINERAAEKDFNNTLTIDELRHGNKLSILEEEEAQKIREEERGKAVKKSEADILREARTKIANNAYKDDEDLRTAFIEGGENGANLVLDQRARTGAAAYYNAMGDPRFADIAKLAMTDPKAAHEQAAILRETVDNELKAEETALANKAYAKTLADDDAPDHIVEAARNGVFDPGDAYWKERFKTSNDQKDAEWLANNATREEVEAYMSARLRGAGIESKTAQLQLKSAMNLWDTNREKISQQRVLKRAFDVAGRQLNNPDFKSNIFIQMMQPYNEALSSMGVDLAVLGDASSQQVFESMQRGLFQNFRMEGTGPQTEMDASRIDSTLGTLGNSPETNKALMQINQYNANIQEAMLVAENDFILQNGRPMTSAEETKVYKEARDKAGLPDLPFTTIDQNVSDVDAIATLAAAAKAGHLKDGDLYLDADNNLVPYSAEALEAVREELGLGAEE